MPSRPGGLEPGGAARLKIQVRIAHRARHVFMSGVRLNRPQVISVAEQGGDVGAADLFSVSDSHLCASFAALATVAVQVGPPAQLLKHKKELGVQFPLLLIPA